MNNMSITVCSYLLYSVQKAISLSIYYANTISQAQAESLQAPLRQFSSHKKIHVQ